MFIMLAENLGLSGPHIHYLHLSAVIISDIFVICLRRLGGPVYESRGESG